jgi:hypothetical protein
MTPRQRSQIQRARKNDGATDGANHRSRIGGRIGSDVNSSNMGVLSS